MKTENFFTKNFYPTPPDVVRRMIRGLDLVDRWVFDPQAGKGNIIDVVHERGAKALACELHPELALIAADKADRFLKPDFFDVTAAEISHVDFIIMNPPFDHGEKHLLHAWDIAPDGCKIVSLLNSNVVRFIHRKKQRGVIGQLIKDHGNCDNIDRAFAYAERPTDVDVLLVTLEKPSNEVKDEFDGYFDLHEDMEENTGPGLMPHNEIVALVNRYVGSVKLWDEAMSAADKINSLASPFNCDIKFGAFNRSSAYSTIDRDTWKNELQMAAWKAVFDKFQMKKYMTSSLMGDLNKFVEQQQHVPFTVKNVFKMVDLIIQTQGQRMEKVIVEVFDAITERHYDNRYQLEGWKTNSEYRVNQKFILYYPGMQKEDGGRFGPNYRETYLIDDLTKAMCHVTGKNFDDYPSWQAWAQDYQKVTITRNYTNPKTGESEPYTINENRAQYREYGKWHDYGFFELKAFKKGTIHMKFKDEKEWDRFNQIACRAKGFVLASKFTSDFRQKSTDVQTAA